MSGLLLEGRGFSTQCRAPSGRLWGLLAWEHPLCGGVVPAGGRGWGEESRILWRRRSCRAATRRLWAREELATALPLWVTRAASGAFSSPCRSGGQRRLQGSGS